MEPIPLKSAIAVYGIRLKCITVKELLEIFKHKKK